VSIDLAALQSSLRASAGGARLQPIGLGRLVVGSGALDEVAGVVEDLVVTAGSRDVVLLSDNTTMSYRGKLLKPLVAEALSRCFSLRQVVVGGAGGEAHADEASLADAVAASGRAACVVSVGSGTVTDLAKAVAAEAASRHVVVQTATSVNGYVDPYSVLLRSGAKRTVPTRWPDAVVIDPGVLVEAPPGLNRAGVGDLLAMFSAPADWYLAGVVGTDTSYSDGVVSAVRERGRGLLAMEQDFVRDGAALTELAETLTVSGIAMGVSATTAPASGMEHTVSHLLEMASEAGTGPTNFHGAQVGAATLVAAATWQRVLQAIDGGALDRGGQLPEPGSARTRIERAFAKLDPSGATAAECYADYERKLIRLAELDPIARLRAGWDRHANVLRGLLVDPGSLGRAMTTAGVPAGFSELANPVEDDLAHWAVAHCHLLRDRFTVADLADLLALFEDEDVAVDLAVAVAAATP
jgi:glycerol-1-phosphate dehydrogenase [NAD(P)+]